MKFLILFQISLLLLACQDASITRYRDAANPPVSNDQVTDETNSETSVTSNKIFRFTGTGAEMGLQQGKAFNQEISELLEKWLMPALEVDGGLGQIFARAVTSSMSKNVSSDFLEEVAAVAKSSGVNESDVMIANSAADIDQLKTDPRNIFGCSTLIISPKRSATGGMMIGRNLDYPDSNILRSKWKAVVFAKQGKLKIFSIHVPGLSGVLTGINEKGVFLAIKVSSGNSTKYGTPAGFIFRSILESATTAKQALDLYVKQKRTVALNVTIADGVDAYELEIDSKNFGTRNFSDKGTLYGANHFELKSMGGTPDNRDDRWAKLAKFDESSTPVTFADLKATIAATGDPIGNVLAVFVDYKAKEITFGSDPQGESIAASGELRTYKFDEIFKSPAQ